MIETLSGRRRKTNGHDEPRDLEQPPVVFAPKLSPASRESVQIAALEAANRQTEVEYQQEIDRLRSEAAAKVGGLERQVCRLEAELDVAQETIAAQRRELDQLRADVHGTKARAGMLANNLLELMQDINKALPDKAPPVDPETLLPGIVAPAPAAEP